MEKLTKALMTDETGQAIVTKLTALSGQMHELAMATRGSAILFESESDISVLGDGGYLAVYVGTTNPLVISGWTGDNSLVTGHLYYLIKSGTAVTSSDLGEYGGTAVTSTTFTEHGVPADDFAVGEALADKADADDLTAIQTAVAGKADSADVDALETTVTDYLGERSENLFWYSENPDVSTGKYYTNTGEKASSSSWSTVDIDVGDYSRIEYDGLSAEGGSAVVSCWFDEEKHFLSSFKQHIDRNAVDVPDEAKYVGLSINRNQTVIDRFTVYGFTDGLVYGAIEASARNLQEQIDAKSSASGYIFYIQLNGSITWTETSPPTLNVGTNTCSLICNSTLYQITADDILTAAANAELTVSGSTISDTSWVLYYDTDADAVKIVKGATNPATRAIISKYPVLFYAHYASVRAGMIVDYMTRKRFLSTESATAQNTANIASISAGISDYIKVVPSYFNSQLQTKIPQIIANMNEAGSDGETFIFITDIHWETNYKNSPALVDYVLKHTKVQNVFSGGDIINEGDNSTMMATLIECIRSFQFPLADNFFPVARGNHDDNSNWSSTEDIESHEFDFNAVRSLVCSQVENKVTFLTNTEHSFYFDHAQTKTRFVFIDTRRNGTVSNFPATALDTLLLATPQDYKLVFIAHYLYASSFKSGAVLLMNMVSAFNGKTTGSYSGVNFDYTNTNGKAVCIIGGHTHFDIDWTKGDTANGNVSGVPIIITDTDSYRNHSGTEGTADSQCFDVVTINYTAKTIKCVRIGRGSDRTFSFD